MKLSFILFLTVVACDLISINRFSNNIAGANNNPRYNYSVKNLNDQLIQHFILHKKYKALRRYLDFLATKNDKIRKILTS